MTLEPLNPRSASGRQPPGTGAPRPGRVRSRAGQRWRRPGAGSWARALRRVPAPTRGFGGEPPNAAVGRWPRDAGPGADGSPGPGGFGSTAPVAGGWCAGCGRRSRRYAGTGCTSRTRRGPRLPRSRGQSRATRWGCGARSSPPAAVDRTRPGCDPRGGPTGGGDNRVKRGGSWNNTAANARVANRNNNNPGNRNNNIGLRLSSTRPGAAKCRSASRTPATAVVPPSWTCPSPGARAHSPPPRVAPKGPPRRRPWRLSRGAETASADPKPREPSVPSHEQNSTAAATARSDVVHARMHEGADHLAGHVPPLGDTRRPPRRTDHNGHGHGLATGCPALSGGLGQVSGGWCWLSPSVCRQLERPRRAPRAQC